mmetsp:Transcript_43639/g.92778  ORF Transcript_43639/g.92778 Transcript_43639/m.92778 type:complete len:200 (+) Transcript_43639:429-1028(+)
MVLHCLSPDHLTPTRLDLVRLCPDLLHLGAHHCFRGLIALPLLHAAHALRIKLIHPRAFPLYVAHDGNVSDAPLHQRLGEHAVVCGGRPALNCLARLPTVCLALALDLVILVHSRGQLEVEFVPVEVGEEVIDLGVPPLFAHLEEEEDRDKCNDGQREIESGIDALGDFLGPVAGVHVVHVLAGRSRRTCPVAGVIERC